MPSLAEIMQRARNAQPISAKDQPEQLTLNLGLEQNAKKPRKRHYPTPSYRSYLFRDD